MTVQESFSALHEAFAAAQLESGKVQAGHAASDLAEWTRRAERLEAEANMIDAALVNVFRALEVANGEQDPRLH